MKNHRTGVRMISSNEEIVAQILDEYVDVLNRHGKDSEEEKSIPR